MQFATFARILEDRHPRARGRNARDRAAGRACSPVELAPGLGARQREQP